MRKDFNLIILASAILSIGLITVACNSHSKPYTPTRALDSTSDRWDLQYKIYTFEGCEYIVVAPGNTHFTWGSHKGNCKNPIHQTK